MFERTLEEAEVTYRSIDFSSGDSLRRCLRRGVGITLCPEIAVQRELEEQNIVQLETHDLLTETPVVMIWHIDKWCSSLLKLFMELTTESIAEN